MSTSFTSTTPVIASASRASVLEPDGWGGCATTGGANRPTLAHSAEAEQPLPGT
ncbi:hypothetical protein ABZ619_25040 [Streptomyces sp. NPDC007851]|uniref:hypothetical protein n=1 Tax=Streptomyces sp. NPDC007851 TaxID=3155008 RepID=UPI0033FA2396